MSFRRIEAPGDFEEDLVGETERQARRRLGLLRQGRMTRQRAAGDQRRRQRDDDGARFDRPATGFDAHTFAGMVDPVRYATESDRQILACRRQHRAIALADRPVDA